MEKIKRNRIIPICFILCLLLSACKSSVPSDESSFSLEEMAASILASQKELPSLYAVDPADGEYGRFLDLHLQESAEDVKDGIFCSAYEANATEVAVFLMENDKAAEKAESRLSDYLQGRIADFNGYAPEQAELAKKGTVIKKGKYVALFICNDTESAKKAFLSCFDDGAKPAGIEEFLSPPPLGQEETDVDTETQTEEETEADSYDHDAVLLAWRTGDTSSLDEKNLAVLEACRDVIESEITEDMSEYEKELAIHDYMIAWGDYDTAVLSGYSEDEPNPDNDNPYGFLIGKKGICLGYATTFQLLMDMIDVECITVRGHAEAGTEDHAWNQVCLDGEWYCVDVTWDDPISSGEVSRETAHIYFNVTGEFMRQMDHQWEESSVVEATGTAYCWKP